MASFFKNLEIPSLSHFLRLAFKYILLIGAIGLSVGTAAAFFLKALNWCTQLRTSNTQLLFLLPIGGFAVGLLYHYWGGRANQGTNLLLEEHRSPQGLIPFKMAPLVLFGTLVTHLFGGSAGREGTAVQMGASIADQLSRWLDITSFDRKIVISMGIAAGFASVFGTPWAGALFALEILVFSRLSLRAFAPTLAAAWTAYWISELWRVEHSLYQIQATPDFNAQSLLFIALSAVLFGCTAGVFVRAVQVSSRHFNRWISYPPLRPFVGGLLVLLLYFCVGSPIYLGLGLPTLQDSFHHSQGLEVFALKILFTALTLGSGFKGGEVTPLFFIGAALGSYLAVRFDLPISFLAAMGFVAVFSGATKAPIACCAMGMELFGWTYSPYIAAVCFLAFFCSGSQSIYSAQLRSPLLFFKNKLR